MLTGKENRSSPSQSTAPNTNIGQGTASIPGVSLPKGGGAIRGIGEKFSSNSVTGTGSLVFPIYTTPGRSSFYPQLSLSYDSGNGNSPFAFGWDLLIPSISRKTDKGLPRYLDHDESDTFLLSGAEDLVPELIQGPEGWSAVIKETSDGQYKIHRYRPRVEGSFVRIERWEHKQSSNIHWRSVSKDNVTNLYGKSSNARITDPQNPQRIFKWLLEQSYDDKGNIIIYEYKRENAENINSALPEEKNRVVNDAAFANCYLKQIKYGNKKPYKKGAQFYEINFDNKTEDWFFHVIFDYGEHDLINPGFEEVQKWPVRPDCFSSYRSTFDIRTYRLCHRVLMFHYFPDELEVSPYLVRSTDFKYNDSDPAQSPVACYLISATQTGYVWEAESQSYQRKSFPPLEFGYTERAIHDEIHFIDSESLENLPIGLDGRRYEWVDLNSEGVSGIMTEQAEAWFYKRNIGNARFAGVQRVNKIPSLANLQSGRQHLLDLAGDGQLDLVQFGGSSPGFYERIDKDEWEPFNPFLFSPNIPWDYPNLRFIDLNGDGHADILISESEVFVWYPSQGEAGFGPADAVKQSFDEEQGPALVFAEAGQSIYLADMSGDGLTDIVRIRNGEICYWPNLGYGRFGAKVTMSAAPIFDYQEYFSQSRIRLADIDGSGTTDIIYIGRDSIHFWFNQAGNSWSEEHQLFNFPKTDALSALAVIDLFGNGTACIVWSSSIPTAAGFPMQYIDLMGGLKPHLLSSMKNNLGAETRVQYTSSTKFYLQDLASDKPWITKLPFPVHVVEKVETYDWIIKNRFVTRNAYHHGYYDGVEREFRGFGMVEQWDTEHFNVLEDGGVFPVGENEIESSHVPPVRTKTWFHTGIHFGGDNVSKHFQDEYYREPGLSDDEFERMLLPDTLLPGFLTANEEREACRALKGRILRKEVYAEDNTSKANLPYTVTEHAYRLRLIQPKENNHHAVFFPFESEAITYQYERNPADPRSGHQMTLDVDEFGNVKRSVSIGYSRRPSPVDQPSHPPEQNRIYITYSENEFINKDQEVDWFRIGLPIETKTYEITGILLDEIAPFSLDIVRNSVDAISSEIPYEQSPDLLSPQKRLIEQLRTIYYKENLLEPLKLGEVDPLALMFKSYTAALTPGLITKVFEDRVNDEILSNEGGYIFWDGIWWIPSGHAIYEVPAEASKHFYLANAYRDAFGNNYTIEYDVYNLLSVTITDPLQNRVKVQNNYRVMLPEVITDPNDNQSAVHFNVLGMVTATAVMGKSDSEGDTLFDFQQIAPFDIDPLTDPHAYLQKATSVFIIKLENFNQNQLPVYVHTIVREKHESDLQADEKTQVQHSIVYFDGFGREIQTKIQAEAGLIDETFLEKRWVRSGWTIFNNKGQVIKKYQPDFDGSHQYEPKVTGVCSLFFYDPLGRVIGTLHSNHTYEKTTFNPWLQQSWDSNDTLNPIERYDPDFPDALPDHTFNPVNDPDIGSYFSRLAESEYLPTWYDQRLDPEKAMQVWPDEDPESGDPIPENKFVRASEKKAAEQAAQHSKTPSLVHFDSLGRTFLTVLDNGTKNGNTILINTRDEFDVEGNQCSVTDGLGRKIMIYDHDMLGTRIHHSSIDSGERWMLKNLAGNPIRGWDSRSFMIRTVYDELQRTTRLFVKNETGQENLAEYTLYIDRPDSGMSLEESQTLNLRGRVYQIYDEAGAVTNEKYDFKGNVLTSKRQMSLEYKDLTDWSVLLSFADVQSISQAALSLLEAEIFTSDITFDAFNRPIIFITPHTEAFPPSEIHPSYNEANLLEKVDVRLRGQEQNGTPVWTSFVSNIDYNANGERTLIKYGESGVTTTYKYDDHTFRLSSILTLRNNGTEKLQALHYTYDPAGNITEIRDEAHQTIFFNNAVVSPVMQFSYDAIYRLIQTKGREHIGQASNNLPGHRAELKPHYDFNDSTRLTLPHPNNGQAMRNYTEMYEYDFVGNILMMIHNANGGTWTRHYQYQPDSNRLRSTCLPSDADSPDHDLVQLPTRYEYDAHGDMIKMPHLTFIDWDYKNQIKATSKQIVNNGGTPEITYYVYDSAGRRLRKVTERQTAEGQTPIRKNERLYFGSFEIYREYDGNGTDVRLERETLHVMDGTQRIAIVDTKTIDIEAPLLSPSPEIRFQLGNHLGSATLEIDSSGDIVSYEENYAYGGSSYQGGRSVAEVSLKRYRYTGKERDDESGFYYYGARYYASWLARWTSCDPIDLAGGINLFQYAHCNPVKFVDPQGTQAKQPFQPPGATPHNIIAESPWLQNWSAALEQKYRGGSLEKNLEIFRAEIAKRPSGSATTEGTQQWYARTTYDEVLAKFIQIEARNPSVKYTPKQTAELAAGRMPVPGMNFHHIEGISGQGKTATQAANPSRAVDPMNLAAIRGGEKSAVQKGSQHHEAHFGEKSGRPLTKFQAKNNQNRNNFRIAPGPSVLGFLSLLEPVINELFNAATGSDLEARAKHSEVFRLTPEQRKELMQQREKRRAEEASKEQKEFLQKEVERLQRDLGLTPEEAVETLKLRMEIARDEARKTADELKMPVIGPLYWSEK